MVCIICVCLVSINTDLSLTSHSRQGTQCRITWGRWEHFAKPQPTLNNTLNSTAIELDMNFTFYQNLFCFSFCSCFFDDYVVVVVLYVFAVLIVFSCVQ